MPAPRRILATALVLGAGALALTGCLPTPPAVPQSPMQPSTGQSTEPDQQPTAGDYPYTVDDEAGDTWAFGVAGLEADPPLEQGTAPTDAQLFAVLIDARHLDGSASFRTCFDIFIEGDDGTTYAWDGTHVAEDDLSSASTDEFSGARAVIELPDGVAPTQVVVRSSYGYPEVPDTVIAVQ